MLRFSDNLSGNCRFLHCNLGRDDDNTRMNEIQKLITDQMAASRPYTHIVRGIAPSGAQVSQFARSQSAAHDLAFNFADKGFTSISVESLT